MKISTKNRGLINRSEPASRSLVKSRSFVNAGIAGGGIIKSLNPLFWIKDLTIISNGYFIDSSGNNRQIQAATTSTPNDSLILPANDASIIAALTAAGCYNQFYVNDSTPKTVLLSNISPCYNDYCYYGYIDKKNLFLCSSPLSSGNRDKILNYLNLDIFNFNSVQGGTASQISILLRCYTNKFAYIDKGNWGFESIIRINPNNTNHTVTSTNYQANTTYRIQLFAPKNDNGFSYLNITSQPTFRDLPLNKLPINITYLYISNINSATGTFNPVLLQKLTTIELSGITNHNTIYVDISYLTIATSIRLLTCVISGNFDTINKNSITQFALFGFIDNVSGSLTGFNSVQNLLISDISNSYKNINITGDVSSLPATINNSLMIRYLNPGRVVYNGGALKPWASVNITINTGLTTAMVDSFIINYAAVAGSGIKTIDLKGNNQPRTASDPNVIAAITTLNGLGKTVQTN